MIRVFALSAVLLTVACPKAGPDPLAHAYVCTEKTGRCFATADACERHRAANDTSGACVEKNTAAYHLMWSTAYGPLEAWFVDEAACAKIRANVKTEKACERVSWDASGSKAH